MTTQLVEEWANAAATDEGHHQTDLVSGLDLRPQLFPQDGSPGALVNRVVSSSEVSGSSTLVKLPSGRGRRIAWRTDAGSTGRMASSDSTSSPRRSNNRASDSDTHCDPLLVAHIEECSLDLLTNVPGDSIRRVGAMQRSTVGLELRWQSIELSVQFFRDEQLEEPGFEIIHDRKLWHRQSGRQTLRSVHDVRWPPACYSSDALQIERTPGPPVDQRDPACQSDLRVLRRTRR